VGLTDSATRHDVPLRELTRYHFGDSDAWAPTPDGYFKVAEVLAALIPRRVDPPCDAASVARAKAAQERERASIEQAAGVVICRICSCIHSSKMEVCHL
jgi:hypothetical protein